MVDYDKIVHCMEGAAIAQAIGVLWGALTIFAIGSPELWLYSSLILVAVPLAGKYIAQTIKTRTEVAHAREQSRAFVIAEESNSS